MPILRRLLLSIACLIALPSLALAHETKAGDLVIEHAWSRASTTANGVAFFTIDNSGKDADKLLSVSGAIADMVSLHTHVMDGEVMRMRAVDAIDIPAGGKAELKPGGLHIMLMGLKAPLKEGQMFPLTLTFQKAGKVEVQVMVEAAGAAAADHDHKQ